MKMQMGDITNFNIFYNEVKNAKLPLKTTYKLSLIVKAIDEQLIFYREKLQEIFQECGEFDDNGNLVQTPEGGIKVKAGCEQQCIERINELQTLEVNLPDIVFSVEEFGSMEMSVEVFHHILPFLKTE